MTNKKRSVADFHASNGRRVAVHDRPLMRLIEFANLPTPISERRPALPMLNEARRALAAVANNPALLERPPYPEGGLLRMPGALLTLWIRARERFPHPTVPGAVMVPVELVQGFDLAEWLGVELLADTIRIVRSILMRVALAQAHREQRPFYVGVPSASTPAARDTITLGMNGRIKIQQRDISGALLEMLATLDLSRLRICRAKYRRERQRCSRLFLALRRDQQECSRQCADLRRHNLVRHPDPVRVRDSEIFKIQLARFKRRGD